MPAQVAEVRHADVVISTDPGRVDVAAVHRFLSNDSYWALGRPLELQQRAIEHSHLLTQVESTGEIVGGITLGIVAQSGSITVALTCSAALPTLAGIAVTRSHAGRRAAPVALPTSGA